MNKPKHIHFIGIKGVGMTPLALIAKQANITVTGCDVDEKFITDESLQASKITPLIGFSQNHLQEVDLVVTTGAHGGFMNPEVQSAKEKNIPVLTQGEAIGLFMQGDILGRNSFYGISVAGSHGKTTTTALIASVLSYNNDDPTYVIGTGNIPVLGAPGKYGSGKYFIAEADEYATEPQMNKTPKFLWQHPTVEVITNIELDHPDMYHSYEEIQKAFNLFTKNIAADVLLILNNDDPSTVLIRESHKGRISTFGKSPQSSFRIHSVKPYKGGIAFHVETEAKAFGEFLLRIPGEHNVYNATATIAVCHELGIPLPVLQKALYAYSGSKRRLEFIGKMQSGSYLYDDYAHHPTEIKTTLHALRQSYPGAKIVCIFQPHTHSRTKKLFNDFVTAFSEADTIVLTDIYASLREEADPTVSSQNLAEKIAAHHNDVQFLPTFADVVEYINQLKPQEGTIILTMGAGDIYKIHSALLAGNSPYA